MFSFWLEGTLGAMLAPTSDETARLLAFLKRNQEKAALVQLQASQDPATGVHVDIEACSSEEGLRPIHFAVEKGFGAVLMELLRMKADLESRNVRQRTALLIGAKSGRRVCVEMLLHAGADTTARDENGMGAIALASVPALREYIVDWVRQHQEARGLTRVEAARVPPPALFLLLGCFHHHSQSAE